MPALVCILEIEGIVHGILHQHLQNAFGIVEYAKGIDQGGQAALPHARSYVLREAGTDERHATSDADEPQRLRDFYGCLQFHGAKVVKKFKVWSLEFRVFRLRTSFLPIKP